MKNIIFLMLSILASCSGELPDTIKNKPVETQTIKTDTVKVNQTIKKEKLDTTNYNYNEHHIDVREQYNIPKDIKFPFYGYSENQRLDTEKYEIVFDKKGFLLKIYNPESGFSTIATFDQKSSYARKMSENHMLLSAIFTNNLNEKINMIICFNSADKIVFIKINRLFLFSSKEVTTVNKPVQIYTSNLPELDSKYYVIKKGDNLNYLLEKANKKCNSNITLNYLFSVLENKNLKKRPGYVIYPGEIVYFPVGNCELNL